MSKSIIKDDISSSMDNDNIRLNTADSINQSNSDSIMINEERTSRYLSTEERKNGPKITIQTYLNKKKNNKPSVMIF